MFLFSNICVLKFNKGFEEVKLRKNSAFDVNYVESLNSRLNLRQWFLLKKRIQLSNYFYFRNKLIELVNLIF